MLDEVEFARISQLLHDGFRARAGTRSERFAPALAEYERLTGFRETNHLALYHHRLSLHGPPCRSCAKPLRTANATRCVACGAPR